MKALLLSEYKKLELVEMDDPKPMEDELLVRIAACGICGSDVHGYDGSTGRRIPPAVMGHEAAGIVEAVGVAVRGFSVGDRVTFDSTVYCGHCFYCQKGQINLCDNRQVIGVSTPEFRRMGAFAEYVAIPARIAYPLPDSIPFQEAALIEAVSVAVHAISLTPISLGDTVVIAGAGMIGLLTLQAAKLAGAVRTIVLDLDESRLALARKLGADRTLNAAEADTVLQVHELSGGRGADVALECVGTSKTVNLCLEAVRKGATVTLVGNVAPKIELGLQATVTRQVRLQGSCASSGEYPVCIDLMASKAIDATPLLTATAPLEEGPIWFDRLYRREPGLLKVVLQP